MIKKTASAIFQNLVIFFHMLSFHVNSINTCTIGEFGNIKENYTWQIQFLYLDDLIY